MKPLRLAADTNVLLDLADGVEAVVDALAVIEQRLPEVDKLVVPTVLDELAFLCDSGQTAQVRTLAQEAIRLLRQGERFRPLLELPFSADLVEEVATALRRPGLLPSEEVHDAFILAETALLDCGLLLTSDEHLCGIDHELLTLVLNPYDLAPPVIASAREIVRKFFR
jgi:hypothetical protein